MTTKTQLEQENANLRTQLYQERQDHAFNRQEDRRRFSEMLAERQVVRAVFRQCKGHNELMQILHIGQANDGLTITVA